MRTARSERALAEALRNDKLILMKTWRVPAALTPDILERVYGVPFEMIDSPAGVVLTPISERTEVT